MTHVEALLTPVPFDPISELLQSWGYDPKLVSRVEITPLRVTVWLRSKHVACVGEIIRPITYTKDATRELDPHH